MNETSPRQVVRQITIGAAITSILFGVFLSYATHGDKWVHFAWVAFSVAQAWMGASLALELHGLIPRPNPRIARLIALVVTVSVLMLGAWYASWPLLAVAALSVLLFRKDWVQDFQYWRHKPALKRDDERSGH